MQDIRQQHNALIWEKNRETVRIEPWGKHSLRVRSTVNQNIRDDLPGALLEPVSTEVQIEIEAQRAIIRNGEISAEIIPQGDFVNPNAQVSVRFLNTTTGVELLAETFTEFPRPAARQYKFVGGENFQLRIRFQAYDDERIYGLGQHQHGRLNQKGCVIDQMQYNTEVCIPFLLSSRGYGFLWNNPAIGRVEFGHNETRWVAEATPQMDYWITAGNTPAEIIERYVDATGHSPMLPEWAAGFWQCKLRYRTQEELLEIAREYKRRGLPLSIIVSDFFHWSKQGDWHFDPACWPDPAAMVRELEEMGVKLMVSIWPSVSMSSANFQELQQKGMLLHTERGVPALMAFKEVGIEGPVYIHYYDSTHPEARRYIWQKAR